jgi:mono/diheme cytochrome c family protein
MSLRQVGVVVFLLAMTLVATAGEPAADAQRGKVRFARSCAPCHGSGPGDDGRAMLPGTTSLQLKYKGKVPALLEARTDLPAAALRVFVRRGSMSMPPFRKTELSDAEIEDIAAYLAVSSKSGETTRR